MKLKRPLRFAACGLFLGNVSLLSGCAVTKITTLSQMAPEGRNYKKILVVIPHDNEDVRNHMENQFSSRLTRRGVEGIPSLTILPFGTQPQSEQAASILKENGIDSVLSLKRLTPYRYATNPGGENRDIAPQIHYEINLYDAGTREVVWMAESLTEGKTLATLEAMMRSLAHETEKKLRKDGLLQK
jgi:hypothetical protein